MAGSVNPLIQTPGQEPDIFSGLDPSVIEFPDKKSPIEAAYHQTLDLEPDHSAQVIKVTKETGQAPEFVASNLDAARKAAAIPASQYFSDVTKKYPVTAKYLSEPTKMAVAKDDIENLTQHESLVRGYSDSSRLNNTLNLAMARVGYSASQIPATALDAMNLLPNMALKAMGKPQLSAPDFIRNNALAQEYRAQIDRFTPDVESPTFIDASKRGDIHGMAMAVADQFVGFVPMAAMLLAAPAAGTTMFGIQGATEADARNAEMGIDPVTSTSNALMRGGIYAAAGHFGTVGPMGWLADKLAVKVGAETASKITLDVAKSLGQAMASQGVSLSAMSWLSDLNDLAINPSAMQGSAKRAAEAGIGGLFFGAAMPGIPAVLQGLLRGRELVRINQTADFYTALGSSAEASKLRERMPEAYREHLDEITKGTPIESVGVPVAKFDTYFQSKKIDPDSMARDMGVFEQLQAARSAGGDLQIPLSAWTEKMVKGRYYNDFKDDIRLHPEDLTVNEQKELSDLAKSQITEAAEKAIKADPSLAQGRDFIYEDLKQQLAKTGQLDPKVAEANAKLGAAAITRLAAMHSMDPKDYYLSGAPLRVIGPHAEVSPGAAEWMGRAIEKAPSPKINDSDLHARAEAIAREEAANYEAHKAEFARWKEVLKAGIVVPKEIAGQADVRDEVRQLPLWMRKSAEKGGRGLDEVAQEAREVGLLGPNEDIAEKLRSLKAPIKNGKAEDYLDQARRELEHRHYQEFFQGTIHQDDLFKAEKTNIADRFTRYITQAKEQGLDDPAARKWAMNKLASEQKALPRGPAPAQTEFRAGGVQGFGRGAKGEQELFQSAVNRPNDETLDKAFGKAVDEVATGKRVPTFPVPLGRTPEILRFIGAKELPLVMDAQVIKKAREKHEVSVEDIKSLPVHLRDPLMVFDSATQPNSMVVLTELQAKGKPVIAAVHLERKAGRYSVNDIASVHGRDEGQIGNWIEKKLARYWDQEKATEWLQSRGLQLPKEEVTPSKKSLLSKADFVNGLKGPETLFQGQASGASLPVISEEAKTGDPYAVFQYNWKLSKDSEPIPYYRLFGDKALIEAKTKIPGNASGNTWRSDVSEETVRRAGIEIRGKSPTATEEPGFGRVYFQGDPETDPRGFIRFTPKEALIKLVSADASTFPHELAHYWLRNFHDFIQTGMGSEQHQADWSVLADWLKVKGDQTDLTRDQQEKFAKGFELYLREGKSPSDELTGVFAKFRRWLTRLYRDPTTLGVELNDNVRGVMSRMLASEDEVAFAEWNTGMTHGDEYAELPNLDPKVRERLESLRARAREEAMNQLLRPQMQEITEENKAFLAKERERATAEAQKGIIQTPELAAMDALQAIYKRDPKDLAKDFLLGRMSAEDREKFEGEAEVQGYSSADEMFKKIALSPSREEMIKATVDKHMEQFAHLKDRGAIREEAMKAVHNEKATELMALEASTFRNLAAEAQGRRFNAEQAARVARLEAENAKLGAKQVIASKPVSDAGKFMPYFTAERNAAMRAQKALAGGDLAAAAEAKRQQMLNHSLVREAYAAKTEIARSLKFFDRFASRKQDLKGMPYGFVRQIDTLLADHGLAQARAEDSQTYLAIARDLAAKGEYPDEIAHRTGWVQEDSGNWKPELIPDTVKRIQNDYRNLNIPESVLTGAAKNYKAMPMAEFRDLKQAVQALNAVGRGYDNFLDESIRMDRREAAAKLREFVEANVGTKYAEKRDIGEKPESSRLQWLKNKGGFLFDLPNAAIPSLVNLYSICDFLDAGNPDGLMKNLVYRPLAHGEEKEMRMMEKAKADMDGLLNTHFSKEDYARLRKDKVYIASRNRSMTKDEILSFALNWGNEANRQRLRDGYKLTEQQAQEILSNVDKKTWDFAQAVWDHMDSYWPQIVAQQEKVSGETPKRVTPAPVSTPFGDYRGGYYPLAYDYTRSSEAYSNIEARNALYKTMGSVAAHTDHGFTEARARTVTSPVRLDSRVMFTHLQDVIHDLGFRQPVVDVNGFLRQKDAREAIINAIGVQGMRTIEQHLKWVASDQGDYLSPMDKLLRKVRFGATIATLGLRPLQAPLSLGGNIVNVVDDIGPVKFGNAVKDFLADKQANIQMIDSLSMRMKERASTRDRDLADLAKRWSGSDSVFGHYTFYMDSLSDQALSYPLWLQTYRGALDKYGQQKAVDMANEAVSKSMGSGSLIDQAMIQRGTEAQKIASWWYSWSGMMFNRAWRAGKLAGLEYDKGNVGTALMITANAAFYGFVLQSANENLWRELFRNAINVDEDKRAKRVISRALLQPVSYIPIARELAEYGIKQATGGTGDLKLPFQSAAETLINPLADMAKSQIEDKQLTPRFWENSARAAALMLKYPQILNTWAFNFIDFLNDQGDLSVKDLLTRRTKS